MTIRIRRLGGPYLVARHLDKFLVVRIEGDDPDHETIGVAVSVTDQDMATEIAALLNLAERAEPRHCRGCRNPIHEGDKYVDIGNRRWHRTCLELT